jgi:hypothetical protein
VTELPLGIDDAPGPRRRLPDAGEQRVALARLGVPGNEARISLQNAVGRRRAVLGRDSRDVEEKEKRRVYGGGSGPGAILAQGLIDAQGL